MLVLPELDWVDINICDAVKDTPKKAGLYLFTDGKDGNPVYLGKASNLRSRVSQHILGCPHTAGIKHLFNHLKIALVPHVVDRDIYETYYINLLKPIANRAKVYTYQTKFYQIYVPSAAEVAAAEEKQQRIDDSMKNFRL